jgi:hypothetical protein
MGNVQPSSSRAMDAASLGLLGILRHLRLLRSLLGVLLLLLLLLHDDGQVETAVEDGLHVVCGLSTRTRFVEVKR